MSCTCRHIPAGAEVLARGTCECRVVYRLENRVVKILKEAVSPETIRRKQDIARAHPDLFAPIDYDLDRHAIEQPFLPAEPPSSDAVHRILVAVQHRGLRVSDITAENVRGGLAVDFSVSIEHATPPREPGIRRSGRTIHIHSATREQIGAAGIGGQLIRWPERDGTRDSAAAAD